MIVTSYSIVSNILSFLSIIAIIILYVFTESYDYKTANTQMGDKKQKIKDLYELLKENDYSKKNQIKQLRNEIQIEINKIKTKSAGVEKNIIRFFELLYVPIILNSLNSIFGTNDVTYSVEMYNVLFVFFFVFMMFLLIYFIYTRIINNQLYWYDMFAEDLQGVLDTKFDIEDDDILEVK